MATIHVGIGHDYDFMVSQFFKVNRFRVIISSDCDSQRGINIPDFLAIVNTVSHCFLNIQDFTTQRKDGLKMAVTPLFGRSTCRIPFDQEQFAKRCILFRAVGQFPWQSGS